MKKEKVMPPASKKAKKTGPGSNPVNKLKKGERATAAEIDSIITGAVENVKPQSGKGFTDEGTVSLYGDES